MELHTDNLEKHLMPRPRVTFRCRRALQAHDAQMAAAGITTVFDAIGVGDRYADGFRAHDQSELLDALDALRQSDRCAPSTCIHVRCELPAPDSRELFSAVRATPSLALVSLMDHTPGQRQWRDLDKARVFYAERKGWSDAQFDEQMRLAPQRQAMHARPNRAGRRFRARRAASRWPATTTPRWNRSTKQCKGVGMSEFPTTIEAAQRARRLRPRHVAGAPNVVRGGSHSGNVSAVELARRRLLNRLSCDYVPASLLQAAWLLMHVEDFAPSEAITLVTAGPARAAGLLDRGGSSAANVPTWCACVTCAARRWCARSGVACDASRDIARAVIDLSHRDSQDRRISGFTTMAAEFSPEAHAAMTRRIERDLIDSFDEEIELELEDRSIDPLAEQSDSDRQARNAYFKKLFRLQGELVKLQDWVHATPAARW